MTLKGYIDRVSDDCIEGWVLDDAAPQRRIVVEARARGCSLAVALADLFRPDVAAGGLGDGRCGFILALEGPAELPSPLDVTVHVANSDLVLPGSPVRVALRRDGRRAAAVGQVDRALGQVVHGWALDPRDPSRSLTVRLREGDRVLATVAANRFRGDLARQRLGDHAFEIWFPLALADGREHLIHVELAETGAALPGSPVTYLGRAEGPRSLLRDLTDAADPAGRGRAADILESYFLQAERDAPGSVTFADYPLWFDHFMAAPPEKSQRARGRLMLVVDLGTDLGAGPEVLRHLSADALVVGVDPAAWNDADESIREAIRRSAGGDVADRAELSPIRILNRLSGSAPGFAGDVFVLWLEPGARLLPGAADLLGRAIDEGADVLYADWESEEAGQRNPQFLPDWNHHYLLSTDYLGPIVAFRAGAVRARPGEDRGDESWAEIRLRALESARPGAIRHIPRILGSGRRGLAQGLVPELLRRHAARLGLRGEARAHPILPSAWAFDFLPPDPLPLVSIIIPTRDKVDLLRSCLESLLSRTAYPAFEVIVVDNASTEPEAVQFLRQIESLDRVRVLRDDRPFNYSALNNQAAKAARGTVIGLLNNDIVLPGSCDPHWLHRVVGRLAAPRVGGVGVKLIYASGLVQHAGVVVGIGGMAENAFKHLRVTEAGYGGRAVLAQEVSAATAAALFLRRESYAAVGGLDEDFLPVAFNDVDLCLKIGARGERIVLDPEIVFFHLESASRGHGQTAETAARDSRERNAFQARWPGAIAADPHYNVNLNLDGLPYRGLACRPGLAPGFKGSDGKGQSPGLRIQIDEKLISVIRTSFLFIIPA